MSSDVMHTAVSAAQLHSQLVAAFASQFGAKPKAVSRAPGRVNLIGEHTDYNGGFVMPCAINFETLVAIRPRADGQVRVLALDEGMQTDSFAAELPLAQHATQGWSNYVRGVLSEFLQTPHRFTGADIAIAGNVPQGAGLSSSASVSVALAHAIAGIAALAPVSPTELALMAQRSENNFVGCQCGIMDQLISAHGAAGQALLIDCRDLSFRHVQLPAHTSVMVVHSMVQRGLVDSEYNQRRKQCEAAAAYFGVRALRDVSVAQLAVASVGLDPITARRARHVVTENQRTQDAAQALVAGDLQRLGELMAQSHASMRDDFAITTPAIDALVALLQASIGPNGGARMTGGGFGGCVVAVLPTERVAAVQSAIGEGYRSPSGEQALVYLCEASQGAGHWPS